MIFAECLQAVDTSGLDWTWYACAATLFIGVPGMLMYFASRPDGRVSYRELVAMNYGLEPEPTPEPTSQKRITHNQKRITYKDGNE
jgi:hypothetical protein